MRLTLALFGCIFLAACATPPAPHTVERSQTFQLSKDEVWQNLMSWFTSNQVQIKTIEKESGVVYAERVYDIRDSQADCGDPGVDQAMERLGQFNVFVQAEQPTETIVTVNATFIERRRDGWTGAYKTITCVSVGSIERSILGAIQQ